MHMYTQNFNLNDDISKNKLTLKLFNASSLSYSTSERVYENYELKIQMI